MSSRWASFTVVSRTSVYALHAKFIVDFYSTDNLLITVPRECYMKRWVALPPHLTEPTYHTPFVPTQQEKSSKERNHQQIKTIKEHQENLSSIHHHVESRSSLFNRNKLLLLVIVCVYFICTQNQIIALLSGTRA